MNYIAKCEKNLGALSDTVKADTHKHWMLQLFLSKEDNLEITVREKKVVCKCIIVDMNIKHNFSTGNMVHFTLLIKPTLNNK
ncbi:MAG: hypothetical protein WCD89_20040 [Anaerocolumna sp.]